MGPAKALFRGTDAVSVPPVKATSAAVTAAPVVLICVGATAALALLAVGSFISVDSLSDVPSWAFTGASIALCLMILGQVWTVLPGRVGEIPTQGWSTSVSLAVVFLAGPLTAVACTVVAALAGLAVDRRRSGHRVLRALADVAALLVAGVLLVVSGAGGFTSTPLQDAGSADMLRALVVVVAAFATHMAVMSLADTVGREGTFRSALDARVRETGVAVAALVVLGPAIAVVLHESGWLAIGAVAAVSAIEILARGGREMALAAETDELTGLLTRAGMRTRIDGAVRAAAGGGAPCALLVIDLDRFTEINDGHGALAGDRVLRVVAQRLCAATRPIDFVARLGGDEFGVLVPGVGDLDTLEDLAKRLRVSLAEVIGGEGPLFGPGASIGIAVAPGHAGSGHQLLARADVAMYAAKDSATGVRVYDERTDHASAERLGLMDSLRSAMDSGRLHLAYQPKVALGPDGDRLAGVEALLRWEDPGRGQVAPGYFIPLVEQTGLMGKLTTAVLDLALDQVARWLHLGERIPVAVNISLRDLEDPDFADRTSASLLHAGVPGSLLTLEITERVLTGDLSAVIHTMKRLERIGVRMSLDDFGTGWSSLLLLRRLPVAEVKLDRSFVDGVDGDDADTAVVQAVVDLARRLNLTMVAEGVERPSTLARLRSIGCDVAQGYLLAEPLKPADVIRWSRRHVPTRLRVVS